ncbi:MAG: SufD family Fe-S cluster assembly protein [Thermoplasmata archaeon]|nr:SufD family Fe-S cluster assembly protein [Thermoplasmata archaeon]
MALSAPRYEAWLPESGVDELSNSLSDPGEYRRARSEAYRQFLTLPLEPDPLYRKYGYFGGVDLGGLDPQARGPAVVRPSSPSLLVVHDASGTHVTLPKILADAGVTGETLPEIWASTPSGLPPFAAMSDVPTDRLTALATALLNRGVRITIPERCSVPVHVQDVSVLSRPHEALSVRRTIEVGEGSTLVMTEETYSTAADFDHQRLHASQTSLDVRADARAIFVSLHSPDRQAVSLYHRSATLGAHSRLDWLWAGFGGFRTRARNHSTLLGNGSELEDLQAFYGSGDQAYDSSVNMTHVGTDTRGHSVTRGLFRDSARGMSRGLVRIEKDARRTVSYLSEHAMLLSKGARSDTIPILEILCRDVKATHSTSVAPVDPEKVFYLESRGFQESDAVRMIGEGFLSHVLERAPLVNLREILYPYLAARWEGRPISWQPGSLPPLPPLTPSGSEGSPDWRFDSKLR